MEPRSMYRPFIEATERYFNRLLPILVPLQVLIFDLWLSVPRSPYTLHTLPTNVSVCVFVKFQLFYHSWDHHCQWYADPRIPLVSLLFKNWEGGRGRGRERLFNRGTCLVLWLREWALIQGRAVIRVWVLIQGNLYGFFFYEPYIVYIYSISLSLSPVN